MLWQLREGLARRGHGSATSPWAPSGLSVWRPPSASPQCCRSPRGFGCSTPSGVRGPIQLFVRPFDGPMEGHEPIRPQGGHHCDLHAGRGEADPAGLFSPTNPDQQVWGIGVLRPGRSSQRSAPLDAQTGGVAVGRGWPGPEGLAGRRGGSSEPGTGRGASGGRHRKFFRGLSDGTPLESAWVLRGREPRPGRVRREEAIRPPGRGGASGRSACRCTCADRPRPSRGGEGR